MSIHAGSPAVGQTKGENNPMKTEFEYFEQLKKDYPDTMTKEQFYKAAHISKATAPQGFKRVSLGGQGGIRTHEPLARLPDFESGPL